MLSNWFVILLPTVDVSLDDVEREWKESGLACQQLKVIADHYGIYSHLFGDAYFYPRVMMDIEFVQEDDTAVPVYRGNIVKPREVCCQHMLGQNNCSLFLFPTAFYFISFSAFILGSQRTRCNI